MLLLVVTYIKWYVYTRVPRRTTSFIFIHAYSDIFKIIMHIAGTNINRQIQKLGFTILSTLY
jgi:hypothetical protein